MKRIIAILAAFVMVLIVAATAALTASGAYPTASTGAAAQPPQLNLRSPIVIHPLHADVSPPLRSIKGAPPNKDGVQGEIERKNMKIPKNRVPKYASVDTVVQRIFGPFAMPTPQLTFEGYSQEDNYNNNAGLGVLPPDTQGDIGPNHYFQWNNIGIRIFNRSGQTVYGPVNGNTLFAGFTGTECVAENDGDPIVLYDHLSGRWLASQFAVPGIGVPSGPTHQCIAISQTSDPTGSYNRYEFRVSPITTTNVFEDYPHFGVWPDAYYMTTNEFLGLDFYGAGVFAFDRAKMIAGDPTATMQYFHLDPPYGGQLPSDLDGAAPPPGSPNYIMEVDDDWGTDPQDRLSIFKFHVDWANPANSNLTGPTVIGTALFDSELCTADRGACVPQKDTPQLLEGLNDRLMYRLVYRNFGTHQALVVNHTVDSDGIGTAGIRWYEVRNPGGTPSIFQQGTYAPADGLHRWMGSIA